MRMTPIGNQKIFLNADKFTLAQFPLLRRRVDRYRSCFEFISRCEWRGKNYDIGSSLYPSAFAIAALFFARAGDPKSVKSFSKSAADSKSTNLSFAKIGRASCREMR